MQFLTLLIENIQAAVVGTHRSPAKPRLHKHAASLIAEWVDAVLFANKKFRVTKDASDRAIAAPIGADGGERIIRTVGSPACIAKNRYGLPGEIALSWTAFINAYQKTLEEKHGKVL